MHGAVVISVTAGRKCFSLSGFRYLSPWWRSVRRWERRGPHAEWPGSVSFQWCRDGDFFANASLEQGDRRPCVCSLRKIVPWWRSSGSCFGLQRAMVWHNVGDDGAARRLDFSSSPRWWWCSVVLCAFVCVVCTLRRVMFDCFLFLYDMAVLLPLISKKNFSAWRSRLCVPVFFRYSQV